MLDCFALNNTINKQVFTKYKTCFECKINIMRISETQIICMVTLS